MYILKYSHHNLLLLIGVIYFNDSYKCSNLSPDAIGGSHR